MYASTCCGVLLSFMVLTSAMRVVVASSRTSADEEAIGDGTCFVT